MVARASSARSTTLSPSSAARSRRACLTPWAMGRSGSAARSSSLRRAGSSVSARTLTTSLSEAWPLPPAAAATWSTPPFVRIQRAPLPLRGASVRCAARGSTLRSASAAARSTFAGPPTRSSASARSYRTASRASRRRCICRCSRSTSRARSLACCATCGRCAPRGSFPSTSSTSRFTCGASGCGIATCTRSSTARGGAASRCTTRSATAGRARGGCAASSRL